MQRSIDELSAFLENASLAEAVKELNSNDQEGFSRLLQSFKILLERQVRAFQEYEQEYNKLLYSYMNLEEKYAQSYTVQLILEEISRELDSDQLLKKTTDIIMGVFGSKRCAIYMVNEENEVLLAKADSGFTGNSIDDAKPIPLSSSSFIAVAWRDRRVYSEADMNQQEIQELRKRNIHGILAIPLNGRRGCLGIMVIEHELEKGFSPDLIEFAKLIAQELSLSVENAYLYGKMREMAIHDALTGVYNRMYLIDYVADVFAKKPATVSLIMFDMDFFKRINDQYGHLAGDLVLKTTTSLIQKVLPAGIIARYGGEEFVIVLPEIRQEQAYELAEKIRRMVGEHEFITAEGHRIKASLSAGLANFPLVSDGYESLLQKADEALYEAKRTGRNKVLIKLKEQKLNL